MSYQIEVFLKAAANTFIDDCSAFIRTSTAPARIAYNDLTASLDRAETTSLMRRQSSANRTRIYKQFVQHKLHFSTSPDRDGKYVYYFLCSIEALPFPRNEEMMFKATMFIDGEPDLAIKQIGATMHALTQRGMLDWVGQTSPALLG